MRLEKEMKKIFLHLPSKFTEIFFNSTNVLILNFNEYKFHSVSFTSLGKGMSVVGVFFLPASDSSMAKRQSSQQFSSRRSSPSLKCHETAT